MIFSSLLLQKIDLINEKNDDNIDLSQKNPRVQKERVIIIILL